MHPIRRRGAPSPWLMLLLCLPAFHSSLTMAAQNMTELSFGADGDAHQLAISGAHGYLASGPWVKILDLSDPPHPREEGMLRPASGSVWSDIMVGSYLCLGGDAGLDLYDVTNPTSPVFVSSYHEARKVTRLVKTGPGRVYVGGCGFWIYENLGSGSLVMEGTWADSNLVAVNDIEIVGNYVYLGILEQVVDWDVVYARPEFVILDISHPEAPTEVKRWSSEEGGPGGELALLGNYVYFSHGEFIIPLAVYFGSPIVVYPYEGFRTDGTINDMMVDGTHLILDTSSGLRIYDNLHLSGSLDFRAPGGYLTRSGNLLYRPSLERGLDVVDLQDPAHPILTSHLNRPNSVGNITLDGNLAYVSAESFFVMDLTDPATPQVVKEFPIWAGRSIVDGDRLYLMTVPDRRYPNPNGPEAYRVVIFDRSDPRDLRELGHADSPTFLTDISETAGRVFAAAYRSLEVYDCRDPLAASLIASLPLGRQTTSIVKNGYYLYVGGYQGDQRSTIQALIVKNPRRPRVVGIVEMTGDLWDMDIYGNLLYAADAISGLRTYDVSAPKHPVLLHTVPGISVAVDRCGTWVAQAISLDGVSVLDGTDPQNPVEIASHEAPAGNYAHSVALQGSLVVSGYSGGLATYRIENAIPRKSPEVAAVIPPPLLRISPNPLRQGAASLTVKVPLNGTARLRVYDIEGRIVRSWEVAGTPGETQEVRWDGTSGEGHGLAQGVYFVQFSAGEKRVTERMLIMR